MAPIRFAHIGGQRRGGPGGHARRQVGGDQGGQLLVGRLVGVDEAGRLVDTASSNTLRTKRALPKPRSRGSASISAAQPLDGAVVEVVPVGLAHRLEDRDQLVVGVVGEVDRAR